MDDEILNYVSEGLIGRVNEEVRNKGRRIDCQRVKPKDSKWLAKGNGRCAFEKQDKIIKIAYSRDGLEQNKGAKKVDKYVNYNKDAFAMPIATSEELIVQEKAETNFSHTTPYKAEQALKNKIDKVEDEDGVLCRDVHAAPDNHGYIQSKGIVLTDLGLCNTVTPTEIVAESSNKRYEEGKPPRERADWIKEQ